MRGSSIQRSPSQRRGSSGCRCRSEIVALPGILTRFSLHDVYSARIVPAVSSLAALARVGLKRESVQASPANCSSTLLMEFGAEGKRDGFNIRVVDRRRAKGGGVLHTRSCATLRYLKTPDMSVHRGEARSTTLLLLGIVLFPPAALPPLHSRSGNTAVGLLRAGYFVYFTRYALTHQGGIFCNLSQRLLRISNKCRLQIQ